ncbi:hypothetical protein [Leifsonia sp. PS1209]|uniref:hypothetical protein n=1 Tax=Leifsonia sp. PS1209 TaxID=2724914 RepID=UPI001442DE5F|nr:hypothetical protein [Leifsonia sp. PS1209]QJA00207.1 hypothetical protein HF024_17965 [Leifsonia sp. PS1209]
MNTHTNSHTTPPAYWFGVIEHELRHRMRDELSDFDLRRGSWRILSTIADGATSVDEVAAALPPRRGRAGRDNRGSRGRMPFGGTRGWNGRGESRRDSDGHGRFGDHPRFASDSERAAFWEERRQRFEELRAQRHGEHPHRPGPFADGHPRPHDHNGEHPHGDHHPHGEHPHAHGEHPHHHDHPRKHHSPASRVESTIADFAERGWVTLSGERNERVELTEAGRAAYESALARIQGVRDAVTAGIAEEDYTTTLQTLEAMARNLGWRERPAQDGQPSDAAE